MIRAVALLTLAWAPAATAYEGFGSVTSGAASCPSGPPSTYTITSLADSGPGTLRDAVSADCRHIVFGVGGTITLTTGLLIQRSYLTIDGSSAPSPGITVSAPNLRVALEASNSLGPISDVIIHHLRFKGAGGRLESADLLELDGQNNPVSRIIIDHNTFIGSGDGNVDIWTEVRDVSVSWNLFMDAMQGQHFSTRTPPNRERISLHHNVYARINERQTRMCYENRQVDFVNNVVYGWGWFERGGRGLMLPLDPGYRWSTLNVEDNLYHFVSGLPGRGSGDDAVDFDSATFPGSVYFDGNIWPAAENDAISTSARTTIPSYAELTHFPASTLGNTVVPCVGTVFPTAAETTLLQQVSVSIGGSGGACPGAGPSPPLEYFTVAPCRLVDTRRPNGPLGGPALAPGPARRFTLAGACGVPSSARAMSVNVTVTQPTGMGHLRIYPGDRVAPLVSSINYSAGQTRAVDAVVSLGVDGDAAVGCYQPGGSVHFILDVTGYFE